MYANDQARSTYVGHSVTTASPARLLVMLVERLALDIERALEAQQNGAHPEASTHLLHAQDIVVELEASLQADRFAGGQQLASLYEFLRNRLIVANVRRDAATTAVCLGLARELCDTWRQAALLAAPSTPSAATA